MSRALFEIHTRRDPAPERLAPLLSDVRARRRSAGLRARLPRRSRVVREVCA